MSDSSPREIRIGETTVVVTRFRGLKAILAGALVSRVMKRIPELQSEVTEFRRHYRETNTITITPAMAKLPQFAPLGLTSADFETAGGNIEFPDDPDVQTIMIHVWPDMFQLAMDEIQKLLAIIAIPNRELELADDADNVEAVLKEKGKQLFREGDIDELLELLAVAVEVLQDQIISKKERLGKLRGLPFLQTLLSTRGIQEQEQPNPTTTESTPSPASAPASSTDSPSGLDGTEEKLSMVSPGTSSGS